VRLRPPRAGATKRGRLDEVGGRARHGASGRRRSGPRGCRLSAGLPGPSRERVFNCTSWGSWRRPCPQAGSRSPVSTACLRLEAPGLQPYASVKPSASAQPSLAQRKCRALRRAGRRVHWSPSDRRACAGILALLRGACAPATRPHPNLAADGVRTLGPRASASRVRVRGLDHSQGQAGAWMLAGGETILAPLVN
jgi:hypothetical protein